MAPPTDWRELLLKPEPGAELTFRDDVAVLTVNDPTRRDYRLHVLQSVSKEPIAPLSDYMRIRWLPLMKPDWIALIWVLRCAASALQRDVAPSVPALAESTGLADQTIRRMLQKRKDPLPGVPLAHWPRHDPKEWVRHLFRWWYLPRVEVFGNRPASYNVTIDEVLHPVDREDGGASFAELCGLSTPEFRTLFGAESLRIFAFGDQGSGKTADSPTIQAGRSVVNQGDRTAATADAAGTADAAAALPIWQGTATAPATAPAAPVSFSGKNDEKRSPHYQIGRANPARGDESNQIGGAHNAKGEDSNQIGRADGDDAPDTPYYACMHAVQSEALRACMHAAREKKRPKTSEEIEAALLEFGVYPHLVPEMVSTPERRLWSRYWLVWAPYTVGIKNLPGFLYRTVIRASSGNLADQTPPPAWVEHAQDVARKIHPEGFGLSLPAARRPAGERVVARPAGPSGPEPPSHLAPLWSRVLAAAGAQRHHLAAGRPVRLERDGTLVVALPGATLELLTRGNRRAALAAAVTSQVREVTGLALSREGTETPE